MRLKDLKRMTDLMFVVLVVGELHASIPSWGVPQSPWHCWQQRTALCDLQQLHADTSVPGEGTCCTNWHTHRNTDALVMTMFNHVCVNNRSLFQQQCRRPRCLASGPWLSIAPRRQRSTPGSTKASRTTWSTSTRSCSAPVPHKALPAWPSKNCTYCSNLRTAPTVWLTGFYLLKDEFNVFQIHL